MRCQNCGSRDIDFQESGGQSVCVNCGTVLEENTLTASIEFQESGDRSHVVGQFVSANCTKPYMSGGGNRMGDGRDMTLINARKVISQVATSLRLPPLYVDRAYRLYQLATQKNLIMRRRQSNMVAACLYAICRQEKSPHLLIDFSDALQVNVFVLGKAFMQFSSVLNLKLPIVDPSLYIHRYASRLDFGDKLDSIITTALRIITRLKKDWIFTGRRPDGICAVALLISARAHKIFISVSIVADLFRITQDTIKNRMEEFRATPSAQLTLEQFHYHDIDIEFDPPSFIQNKVDELYSDKNKVSREEEEEDGFGDSGGGGGGGGGYHGDGVEDVHIEVVVEEDSPEMDDDEMNDGSFSRGYVDLTLLPAEEGEQEEKMARNGHVPENESFLLDDLYGESQLDSGMTKCEPTSSSSSSSGPGLSSEVVRSRDGTLCKKLLIGDIEVDVPLPCLQRQRKLSIRSQQKQIKKKQVYAELYNEVYSAKDVVAAIHGSNEESKTGVTTSSVDDAVVVVDEDGTADSISNTVDNAAANSEHEKRKREVLLSEARRTCRVSENKKFKKRRKEKAVSNSKCSWTVAVKLDGSTMRTGYHDRSSSEQTALKTEEDNNNNCNTDSMREGDDETHLDGEEVIEGGSSSSSSSRLVDDKELLSCGDLDSYLLNEEEKQKRCAIWEKTYRGFMDERARKQRDREQAAAAALSGEDMYTQSGKLKKKYTRRAGNKNSSAARTAAEAAMQYVGQYVKPSSRKINYEALKGVFKDDGSFAAPDSSSSLASNTGLQFQQTASSSNNNKSILKSGGAMLSSSMMNNNSSSKSNATAAAVVVTGAAVRFAPLPEDDEEVYEEDEEMVVGGPSVIYEDNDYDEYGGDEYY